MLETAIYLLVCLAFAITGYIIRDREAKNAQKAEPGTGSVTYWTPERLANLSNHTVSGGKPGHEPYEAGLPTRAGRDRG